MLHVKKLRHRDVKTHDQAHRAHTQQSWDFQPGIPASYSEPPHTPAIQLRHWSIPSQHSREVTPRQPQRRFANPLYKLLIKQTTWCPSGPPVRCEVQMSSILVCDLEGRRWPFQALDSLPVEWGHSEVPDGIAGRVAGSSHSEHYVCTNT